MKLTGRSRHNAARSHQRGFTMVEIAICLGVIGFALVAIIGILPHGMNQQRDNRFDTYLAQDAAYWMEAIRSGAQGLDDLTNHVEEIAIVDLVPLAKTNYYSFGVPSVNTFSNGREIIGLLSTPGDTNVIVQARVRAISGGAAEKGTQMPDFTFRYLLQVDNRPLQTVDPNLPDLPLLANYLREVRLAFRWPVLANGTSSGRPPKVFRTQVSGTLANDPSNSVFYYFRPL